MRYRDCLNLLVGWVFPPRCPVCDGLMEVDEKIHPACEKKLIRIGNAFCMCCGRPITREEEELCNQCRRIRPFFRQGKALFVYAGEIKQSMYRYKYKNRREYAVFFAEEAILRYGDWISRNQIDCITSVPMYRKKRRRRGYNQAEVFASRLAERMNIPCDNRLLVRREDTPALKRLDARGRMEALKNAFGLNDSRLREKKYRRVLIVDDIYTTGSTMNSITRLFSQEAEDTGVLVYVLTICIPRGFD